MSLPEAFVKQIEELLSDESEALIAALNQSAPVSVRLNPSKNTENLRYKPVLWSSDGCYLKERPAFTFDPLLHAGCYYVQEASSMFLEQALRQAVEVLGKDGLRMLDLCAAPGGKSTLAASVLPKESLLVANELIRTRANILAENLIKWGQADVVVTQSDSSAFSGLTNFFDIILTDVPCSGEGMFRKDRDSISEWSVDNVRLCASRQRDILGNCWAALRPGGCLIYSTCTYNTLENEENVHWICQNLGARLLKIPVESDWNISGALKKKTDPETTEFPVYRFLPHKTKGEGFFLALLQKTENDADDFTTGKTSRTKSAKGNNHQKGLPEITATIRHLLISPEKYDFSYDYQGRVRALPKIHQEAFRFLEEKLRIVHAGIVLGEMKGKDLLPDISLALSTELNLDAVQTCPLDLRQSVAYLRREAISLPETCPLGWVLMLYQGHPLGWMKNIGNRANNAYPNEWRIRSENPY
ncbi:MAG: rRNA cytosine-C5-methyltransferase [Bacteroidales bacterium]|nr:rRNA cytosine-C5-methyltransferase [Bacteroidales bacterium]